VSLPSADELEDVIGVPIVSLDVQPLRHNGYSGALLERVDLQLGDGRHERLVRKRVRPATDWPAYLTRDLHGREAMLLAEPRLSGVWEIFECPYVGVNAEDGEVVLLMRDLSECLLPDVDSPLDLEHEERLLAALARLHARYWRCDVLDQLEWLAQPQQILSFLGPEMTAPTSYPLLDMCHSGWTAALDMLPKSAADWLLQVPHMQPAAGLPHTLVHGDAKVANFALLPGARVAAFDWGLVGVAPCTLDLGWYLAVNAGRLARPKEEVVSRYRALLQDALGEPLPDDMWHRLTDLGILTGVRMLLWEKALAAREGSARAVTEFTWWAEALQQLV
jgi:Phosphotransferase enzyme family